MRARASTPIAKRLRRGNAAASIAVVLLACLVFALLPVHRDALLREHALAGFTFRGAEFLLVAALAYAGLVAAWMLRRPRPQVSGPLRCLAWCANRFRAPAAAFRNRLRPKQRLALLSTLLKAFFGPLMVMSLLDFCMGAWRNAHILLAQQGAGGIGLGQNMFWFMLQALLFVDVALFTLGYLFESRRLGNEIRSVDPSWLGWVAALSCYPPFNSLTAAILGSQHEDFPRFADPTLHLLANAAIILLMAGYAAASLALGFKASNLTHRGIVARGPYAWVRHPAYTCKNIAWWIGSAPLVWLAFDQGLLQGAMALASVAAWTALYVLRALTEEDHLRSVDGDYAAYAAAVRFRFVPGVV